MCVCVCVCSHDVHVHAQRYSIVFRELVVREQHAALLHEQSLLLSRVAFSCGLVRGLAVRSSHPGRAIVDRLNSEAWGLQYTAWCM